MQRALVIAMISLVGMAGCSDDNLVSPSAINRPDAFRNRAVYRPEPDPTDVTHCYAPWCGCYVHCGQTYGRHKGPVY